jgi:hypothetical protein
MLPVDLYGCKTGSFTLRKAHRFRVFENRVLRRIFGPNRDEMAGGWRKLQNEGVHNLFFPPNITRVIKSRKIRWKGHVVRMGEIINAYKF